MDKNFQVKTLTISLILNLVLGISILSVLQNLVFPYRFEPQVLLDGNPVYDNELKPNFLPWWGIPALFLFKNNSLIGFPLLLLQFFLGWFFWWIFISGTVFIKRTFSKRLRE